LKSIQPDIHLTKKHPKTNNNTNMTSSTAATNKAALA